jgi:hypothetical protein
MPADLATLEARVRDLELQNRRMKALGASLAAMAAAVFLVSQAAPVEDKKESGKDAKAPPTDRLAIKDRDGKERVVLGHLGGPVFGLALLDEEGRKRLVLSVDDLNKAPFLSLRDENGVRRIAMTLLADGTPAIVLRNEKNEVLASLGILPPNLSEALKKEWLPGLPRTFPFDGSVVTSHGFLRLVDAGGKDVFTAPGPADRR